MTVNNYKPCPVITIDTVYEAWKNETEIWRLFTSYDKRNQAPTTFLSSAGPAREVIVGLDINKLSCHQDVKNLIKELNRFSQR